MPTPCAYRILYCRYMFPGHESAANGAASVRQPLGNIVEDSCPRQKGTFHLISSPLMYSIKRNASNLENEIVVQTVNCPDIHLDLQYFTRSKANQ
jgi:hypothetical protein